MSEKIYGYLLRLFPSAFRRRYEEESIRLLRDRLSEERGFLRRLRLSFDLLVDIVSALPQAYRNSYAEVAPAALATHFEGVPSFRSLEQEPMQRGTIILAGFLSLTSALAALTYIMLPSGQYRSTARISPIESVLERLNGSISPDSAGSVQSDAPMVSSADNDRPRVRPKDGPGTLAATSVVASGTRQIVQRQPETARNLMQGANLSGSWTASLPALNGATDIPREFVFNQKNAVLAGTARADSSGQLSIMYGEVAGNTVRFELDSGQRRLFYDLKIEGKELRGALSIRTANENRNETLTVDVSLNRTQ